MSNEVDILENDIVEHYPGVLEILLSDNTTKQNIYWATDNYQDLGEAYKFNSLILPELITGVNGSIIMPRVKKEKDLQQSRVRNMAEVFTPSWICNAQNNLIDNAWFNRESVFNKEVSAPDGSRNWQVNTEKIAFPEGKTWKHYLHDARLEMACGEAPYITSRYDATTSEYIPIENRIGFLDRKFRVISENVDKPGNWLEAAQTAYKRTYAFEFQGDSLILAREAMLFTFIENYVKKFSSHPLLKSIQSIANIISWNVWQMDGMKGVVPGSCVEKSTESTDLFGDKETKTSYCEGCLKDNIRKHNGIYCVIKDWSKKDPITKVNGCNIRFIDILKKQSI